MQAETSTHKNTIPSLNMELTEFMYCIVRLHYLFQL
jgi:hypothetical protein